ncbi:hypothetical protein [Alkalihalobacillus trypoxylicola]|uniref:hypothetical protein n=1 Tax=Alkalihalobacillus trypoxylicola TaxID=519424 RepID=UPI0007DC36CD|nr:hypothetical protein [Alkalihalobacillus trypoxylicola]
MFYYSKKQKIRGWKRQKRKIERWKQAAIDLDIDYIREYQRTNTKLSIPPFYRLIRRNPPSWYNTLLLEAMLEVYMEWHQKMKKENEDFYLKIWLYHPHFIESQIVVAYKDYLHAYDDTFIKRTNSKPFPYHIFQSLQNQLKQFEWELCMNTLYYDESEFTEWIMDGQISEKEVQAIKQKAYDVSSIHLENDTQYLIDKGDVWVGTLSYQD